MSKECNYCNGAGYVNDDVGKPLLCPHCHGVFSRQPTHPKVGKVKKVCTKCGSEDVVMYGHAAWDINDQRWEVVDHRGETCCNGECQGDECDITDAPMKIIKRFTIYDNGQWKIEASRHIDGHLIALVGRSGLTFDPPVDPSVLLLGEAQSDKEMNAIRGVVGFPTYLISPLRSILANQTKRTKADPWVRLVDCSPLI